MKIRIKICGITRLRDAEAAVNAGVDGLGFIFCEKSPRYIKPEKARQIIELLPPFVDTVGVFVDKKRKEAEEIINYCRLNYAQLHGDEPPKYCERLARFAAPCTVIKAFRMKPGLSSKDFLPYNEHVKGFLLDSFSKNQPGGTGLIFDWNMVEQLKIDKPVILAGGLGVDNVTEGLSELYPYGVDLNSALESKPGKKDARLIYEVVEKIRAFEREHKTKITFSLAGKKI